MWALSNVRSPAERACRLRARNYRGVSNLALTFWSVAGDPEVPVRYRLIVNSTDAACDAAKAGVGIISVFSHHVTSSFQNGSLVPVLPDFERRTLPLSLVHTSGEYLPLKLRAFLDFATPRLKVRLSAARDDFLAATAKG